MAKVKIMDIAADAGFSNSEVIKKANELGLAVKVANSGVSEEEAAGIYEYLQTGLIPEMFKAKLEAKKPAKKPAVKKESPADEKPAKATSKATKAPASKEKTPEIQKPEKPETPKKAEKAKPEKPEKAEKAPKPEKPEKTAKATKKEKPQSAEIQATEKPQKITKPEFKEPEKSLAEESLAKRRGLVIVKKKRDEKAQTHKEKSPLSRLNERIDLKDMFSSAQNLDKKPKKAKQKPVAKKDSATKIDLLGGGDFGTLSTDYDEDVVVLPDFSETVISQPKPEFTQKKQPAVLRQSFNQFTEGGIGRRSRKKPPKRVEKKELAEIKAVQIPKEIRLYEFADKIGKNTSELISKLFMLGLMTTKNDFLDEDAIEILAAEFGIEVQIIDEGLEFDYVKEYESSQKSEDLSPRAPVITIMGHVDHGKTSLLDYIRKSRIANAEAGGITQHVGAYMVEKNSRKITFIDTPGHEAFTAMRARGASITDIVIIVVAADDGVKPQTKEAINHAKSANVPIIIAINKIDKEDLRADEKARAKASVIESSVQKGRGAVATVIVQNGTLRVGDTIVAGVAHGKVRALSDDTGKALKEIKPGECGVIVGLSEVSDAGEVLIAVQNDKEAREYAAKRYEHNRQKELSKSTKVSIDELGAKIKEGNLKSLPLILKADVQGSLEALKSSLEKLKNDEIKVDLIHAAVGGITQSDIELASASENSIVLGFNIRPTGEIKERAKERGVEIKTYNVIYNLIDEVKALLGGLMSPIISEEQLGQAEIRQVITVPKIGQIAGCMVSEGLINRGAKIRLIREGVVIFEGNVSSLKRFKDDVKEVAKGYECGVGIEGCADMRVGDYIESYKTVETQAVLE